MARGSQTARTSRRETGLFIHPSSLYGMLMGVSVKDYAWSWAGGRSWCPHSMRAVPGTEPRSIVQVALVGGIFAEAAKVAVVVNHRDGIDGFCREGPCPRGWCGRRHQVFQRRNIRGGRWRFTSAMPVRGPSERPPGPNLLGAPPRKRRDLRLAGSQDADRHGIGQRQRLSSRSGALIEADEDEGRVQGERGEGTGGEANGRTPRHRGW